jgi:hypothetical protein
LLIGTRCGASGFERCSTNVSENWFHPEIQHALLLAMLLFAVLET